MSVSSREAILSRIGPASLSELCLLCLKRHLRYLKDVGDTSLGLLGPLLLEFSPGQLQAVEDATLRDSGRDIRSDTWPLWFRHCTVLLNESINLKKELKKEMKVGRGLANADSPLRALVADAIGKGSDSMKPADYRQAYTQLRERKQELLVAAGRSLRSEFQKTEKKKTIKLIDDPLAMGNPRKRPKLPHRSAQDAKTTTLAQKLGICAPAANRHPTRLQRESIVRKINKSNQSARYKTSQLPTQKQLTGR